MRKILLVALLAVFLVPCGAVMAQEPTVPGVMTIDIKPGSCDNPVNFKSRGLVPVAILLEETITPAEIREIPVEVAYQSEAGDNIPLFSLEPVRTSPCDISTPGSGCGSRARDGFKDVLLKYKTQDLVEALSEDAGVNLEIGDQQEITLVFTATLADGTTMEGSDTILAKRLGIGRGQAANGLQNRNTIGNTVRNNTGNAGNGGNAGSNTGTCNENCTNNCNENCINNGTDSGNNGTGTGTNTRTSTSTETNTRTGWSS